MRKIFMTPDGENLCLRKLSGFICVVAGIFIMMYKMIFFSATGIEINIGAGNGKFLVGSGITLLTVSSIEGVVPQFLNKEIKDVSESQISQK